MSALVDCCSPCTPTVPPVNVPGASGQNAFSVTAAAFTVPAANATVVATVDSTAWMVVGQAVTVGKSAAGLGGPANGTFVITTIPSSTTVTLQWLGYASDGVVAGNVMGVGSTIAPAGLLQSLQSGTTALAAGTKLVTGVTLTAASVILLTAKTASTPGFLSAPSASRNVGAGSFVISSSNVADASTVDWLIVG